MRTFRGYASRASAGILADDPQSASWSRTDQQDGRPPGPKGGFLCPPGLEGRLSCGTRGSLDDQDDAQGREDLSPVLPASGPRGLSARLGEALLPRLSFRALALALLVNVLLALGFARLVEEDILRLPKPVFWISLESPSGTAGTAQAPQSPAGRQASGASGERPAETSPAARARAFARAAAGRLAGKASGRTSGGNEASGAR